ncbi:MAG: hypothetical protein B6D36_00415 [Planctomycetes bacterium UTPLA1]|nr:MAG: hypothetical protein B6D36_00415 [Planctomycetes bacterium UTPLA1]
MIWKYGEAFTVRRALHLLGHAIGVQGLIGKWEISEAWFQNTKRQWALAGSAEEKETRSCEQRQQQRQWLAFWP